MKFKGSGYDMWDAWYLPRGNTIHAFHLKSYPGRGSINVGHLTTRDLVHFEKQPDVLPLLPEETHPDDCLGKYTGCAYYEDGTYYLYYTMRDRYRSEKIGLATSRDGVNFTYFDGNPVLTPDETLFVVREKGQKTDCRDMLIVKENGIYYGFFAAMIKDEKCGETGAIGVATSRDLTHWGNQRIAFKADGGYAVEVPDVFKLGDTWYLTMLTGRMYGAEAVIGDDAFEFATIYATSDSLDHAFTLHDDRVLLGGAGKSGYTCRSTVLDGVRYGMYIERGAVSGSISLPKRLDATDGRLRMRCTDRLVSCRTGKMYTASRTEDFTLVRSSLVWNTYPGRLSSHDVGITLTAHEAGTQTAYLNEVTVTNAEFAVSLTPAAPLCGFVFRLTDAAGKEQTVRLAFSKKEQRVTAYTDGIWDKTLLASRRLDLSGSEERPLRMIVCDDAFELYIADELYLQGAFPTRQTMEIGVFSTGGEASFDGFCVYEWQN